MVHGGMFYMMHFMHQNRLKVIIGKKFFFERKGKKVNKMLEILILHIRSYSPVEDFDLTMMKNYPGDYYLINKKNKNVNKVFEMLIFLTGRSR